MKLEKCLTEENINQNLLNIQYAVRGPILQRALQIERELVKVSSVYLVVYIINNIYENKICCDFNDQLVLTIEPVCMN